MSRGAPGRFWLLAILVPLAACAPGPTAPGAPGAGSSAAGGTVVAGAMRFTVLARECVRIEYSAERRFIDAPSLFAARRDAPPVPYTVGHDGGWTTLDTGRIRLRFRDDGRPPGPYNLTAEIQGGAAPIAWRPGQANPGNLGGTLKALGGVQGPVDLGQGLLSRDGWYLLDDSSTPLLTRDGWVEARPPGARTDWYLFGYGLDYAAALRAMTTIAGSVPLPRRYALGSWYSWYWPLKSSDYRAIVDDYAKHDLPLDVLVMDTDWHGDGWTGWSWNRDLLPDAEALVKSLHDRGVAVTLNAHPAGGVGPQDEMYGPFMQAMGAPRQAAGRPLPFDAADRNYLETFFRLTHEPRERDGVDFWWVDWQQAPMTRGIPGLSNLAWLNDRYYRRSERDGRRGQILSRWAGWGDHRNVMHFSGDAEGRWPVLRFEVPFTATAGNVGCFFWSHDIGGHRGVRDEEMFTRWVQFGALSAALRLHSTRAAELDRRPWTYGPAFFAAMREAFRLRARLFPYIYSSAWESHADSLPLLRPLYLAWPGEDHAYANPQEYLLGDAILAAPIAAPGVGPGRVATQAVWFPPGRWHDWFSGAVYEGNQEVVVSAALDEIPLFVREGVPVPLQAATQRMSAGPPRELVVRCYPGEAGSFELYEDDGTSAAYATGAHAKTALTCARDGGKVVVTLQADEGRYEGMPEERAYVVELAGTARATSARVDDRPAAVEYDPGLAINRIRVPSSPIRRRVVVEALAAPADFEALRAAAEGRRRRAAGQTAPAPLMHRKGEGLYLNGGPDRLLVQDRDTVVQGPFTLTVDERVGDVATEVLRHAGSSPADLRLDLPPFPKMTDAPVGSPLVRSARLEFLRAGRPAAVTRELDRRASALRRFSIVGPFPYEAGAALEGQRFAPESGTPDLDRTYEGVHGAPVAWSAVSPRDDGTIDLRAAFGQDNRIAYGVTFLRSPRAQPVSLKVWSDDGVEIWLNGARIHLHDVVRALDLGPDMVAGTVRAGVNTLLVKVANTVQGWGFRIEIASKDGLREAARPELLPPATPGGSR